MRLQSGFFQSRVYFFNGDNTLSESVRVHENPIAVFFLKCLGKVDSLDTLDVNGKKVYVNLGSKLDKMKKLSEAGMPEQSKNRTKESFQEWVHRYVGWSLEKMPMKRLQIFFETEVFFKEKCGYPLSGANEADTFNPDLLEGIPADNIQKLDLKKIKEQNVFHLIRLRHNDLTKKQLADISKPRVDEFLEIFKGETKDFLNQEENQTVVEKWLIDDKLAEDWFNDIKEQTRKKIKMDSQRLKELFQEKKLGFMRAQFAFKNNQITPEELFEAETSAVEAFFMDIGAFKPDDQFKNDILPGLLKRNKISHKLWSKWVSEYSVINQEIFNNLDLSKVPSEQLKILLKAEIDGKEVRTLLTDKQLLSFDYTKIDTKVFDRIFMLRVEHKDSSYSNPSNRMMFTTVVDGKMFDSIFSDKNIIEAIGSSIPIDSEAFKFMKENLISTINLNKFKEHNLLYFFREHKEKITQKQMQLIYVKLRNSEYALESSDYKWLAEKSPNLIKGLNLITQDKNSLNEDTVQCLVFAGCKEAQNVYRENRQNK